MDPDAGDERQELLQSYLGGGIGRRVFVKRLLASGVSLAAAGTYRYRCKDPHHASTMTGTVKVPVGRKPVVASAGSQFTISWARAAAQPGYLFDIQFKRPSDSVFKPFRSGITTPSAHFTPSVTGPYQFRARLRNKANGKACGWSPIASIS